MVLPPPAADAGALEAQAQLAELIEQLDRATRGVLFALTDGTSTSLGWVVWALSPAPPWASDEAPALVVRLHGPELAQVPRGSRVLLRVVEDELAWLNMYRPVLADLELRAVLWAPTRAYDRLVREAVDLASWILQDLPLPARELPEFARAGVAAAIQADAPFAWRGPGLERCLQTCGDPPTIELSADLPILELLGRLRGEGLPIVTKVDDEARAWRVRMAMALVGRSGVWIARDPAGPLVAMPCLHAEQDDWEAASLRLREAGWRRPELMAAWVELEPETIDEACEAGDRAPRDPGEFAVEAIARAEVPVRVWRARVGDAEVREATRWDDGPQARLHRALTELGERVGSEALIDEALAAGFVDVALVLALRRFDADEATEPERLVAWLQMRGEVARALAIAQAWLAKATDEGARVRALSWTGDLHRALGHADLALRTFDDALDLAKQLVEREPDRADLLRDLAVSYDNLGDLHRALGHADLALRYLDDALSLAKQLVEREPGRADFLRDLSRSYVSLGDLHPDLGQPDLALRYLDDALSLRRQLVEREPGRADLLRDLADSYNKSGDLHRALGHADLALRYLDDALDLRRQLVEREPGRADLLRDLSVSYNHLATLHRDLGHPDLALRYLDDALDLRRQLVEREPGRADLLRDLSVSYNHLGDLHRNLGHPDLALRYFEQDLAITKQLVEREPGRADLLRDLASSFECMATVQTERAAEWLGQSIAIRRRVCRDDPTHTLARGELAFALVLLGFQGQDEQALHEGFRLLAQLRSAGALEARFHDLVDKLERALGST